MSAAPRPRAHPSPRLTAVALPIPDVTLYQVLHPQAGAHTALRDGVAVTVARAPQKAACEDGVRLRPVWRQAGGRGLASAQGGFSLARTPWTHLAESRASYGTEGAQGVSPIRKQTAEKSQSTPGNKSLKNVANT